MIIELEPITEKYFPKQEGIYLVKAISTSKYPFKKPYFLQMHLSITIKENGEKSYAFDMNNQIALEISTKPIL